MNSPHLCCVIKTQRMKNLKEQIGSWAIVTGASSGIGEEFANQLAANGINLILLARRENLLKELSDKLTGKYGIKVKSLPLDLTDENFIDRIDKHVEGLKVGLLVSNAGGARMGAFTKIPMEDLEMMLRLNTTVHMKLSHWFSNRLIDNNQRGNLMMVSSTTAYQGVPYAANYAAAKAYILNLGEALNFELKDKGVNVTVLVPGPTRTPGLTENKDADMMSHLPMKPQEVDKLVNEGLRALLKNKPTQIGGAMNRVMDKVMKTTMSRKGASAFWGKMMKKMVTIK